MSASATYPHAPGHRRNRGPSIEAAAEIGDRLKSMQLRVADCIRESDSIGEEIAVATGISVYTVRARTAELNAMGWIRDSGLRRRNPAGRRCTVWAWVAPSDRQAATVAGPVKKRCGACGSLFIQEAAHGGA